MRADTRTVLVTGGTGFLGRHVVERLLARGDVRVKLLASGSLPDALAAADIAWVRGSVTDREVAREAVEGAEVVVHLAGRVSRSGDDARLMHEVHVEGTRVLLEAAAAAGARRVILASTSGTVAVSSDPNACPDEEARAPLEIIARWPYYASKYYQEQVARRLCQEHGMGLCMLQPSLLLGPGDERLSSTGDILRFLRRDLPFVPSGGLSFVDVRDVAEAFVALLDRPDWAERYLLGGANWTFAHFFGRLERMTKVPAPRVRLPDRVALFGAKLVEGLYQRLDKVPAIEAAAAEMATYYWYLDDSKARRDLGFTTRDPTETLYETVQYLEGRGSR